MRSTAIAESSSSPPSCWANHLQRVDDEPRRAVLLDLLLKVSHVGGEADRLLPHLGPSEEEFPGPDVLGENHPHGLLLDRHRLGDRERREGRLAAARRAVEQPEAPAVERVRREAPGRRLRLDLGERRRRGLALRLDRGEPGGDEDPPVAGVLDGRAQVAVDLPAEQLFGVVGLRPGQRVGALDLGVRPRLDRLRRLRVRPAGELVDVPLRPDLRLGRDQDAERRCGQVSHGRGAGEQVVPPVADGPVPGRRLGRDAEEPSAAVRAGIGRAQLEEPVDQLADVPVSLGVALPGFVRHEQWSARWRSGCA